MNAGKLWVVIILGVLLLNMGAVLTEEQLALFHQLDSKSVAELGNKGLAQYLSLRTVVHDATTRPSAGEMIAHCALKQMQCQVAIPSRTEDLTKVHCVSIVSRSLAMALARDWDEYYILLSRIVYKQGMIDRPVCTDPIVDWVPNNAWALVDLTAPKYLAVEPVEVPVLKMASLQQDNLETIPVKMIALQDMMQCVDVIHPGDIVFILAFRHFQPYVSESNPVPVSTRDKVYHVYHQAIAARDENNEVVLVSNWRGEVKGFPLKDLTDPAVSKRNFIVGFKIFRVNTKVYEKAAERIAAYHKRYTCNKKIKVFPHPDPESVDLNFTDNKDLRGLWFGLPVEEFKLP